MATCSCTRRPCQPVSPRCARGSASSSATPSLSRALRKPPDEMAIIVEDLNKLLDRIGEGYRRGRHPDPKSAGRVAQVLRGVADDLEV